MHFLFKKEEEKNREKSDLVESEEKKPAPYGRPHFISL